MAAVSVEAILAGRAEGHKLRWAQDFLDKHPDSNDNAMQVLRDHMEDARAAQIWRRLREPKEQQPQYENLLQRLNSYGDAFPTQKKLAIIDKKLSQLSANSNVAEYMEAVCPWPRPGKGLSRFKPISPALVCIEGGVAANSGIFRTKVLAYFTTLAKRGPEGEGLLLKCIDEVLGFIDKNNPEPDSDHEGDVGHEADADAVDQAIDCIVSTAKALRLLLTMGSSGLSSSHLPSAGYLQEMLVAKDLRGPAAIASPLHALSTELSKCTCFFKEKTRTFEVHMPVYQQYLPPLEDVVSKVSAQAPSPEDGEMLSFFKDPLKSTVLPAIAQLPQGHCDEMLQAFQEKLQTVFEVALAAFKMDPDSTPAGNKADVLKTTKSLRGISPLAEQVFPKAAAKWATFQSELGSVHDSTLKAKVVTHVLEVTSKAGSPEALISDKALFTELEDAIVEAGTKFDSPHLAFASHEAAIVGLARHLLGACGLAEAGDRHRCLASLDWSQSSGGPVPRRTSSLPNCDPRLRITTSCARASASGEPLVMTQRPG